MHDLFLPHPSAEMKLPNWRTIRAGIAMLSAIFWLSTAALPLRAQSSSDAKPAQAPAKSGDNPFPEEQSAQPVQQKPGSNPSQKPPGQPSGGSENPFPGENTNAPILPPAPGASPAPSGNGNAASAAGDGDPVRSPDLPGSTGDDGFSSSRNGLGNMPAENDSDTSPGKSIRTKTREQLIQEDLDVGRFYIEKKNWKAAQLRFSAAFALDKENADAVWGLAEAERHLQMNKEAAEHYQLFLSYDPDGPHSKSARKALDEVEAGLSSPAGKN